MPEQQPKHTPSGVVGDSKNGFETAPTRPPKPVPAPRPNTDQAKPSSKA